jgi:hypothetical protein
MEETPSEQYQRLLRESAKPKANKYAAQPIKREGVRYDSQAEYNYKGVLDMQVLAGQILGYDYHVKIPLLTESGALVGYYEADYVVYRPGGEIEYHDVKAPIRLTDLFQWKARHIKAQYKTEIILIDSKTLKPRAKK